MPSIGTDIVNGLRGFLTWLRAPVEEGVPGFAQYQQLRDEFAKWANEHPAEIRATFTSRPGTQMCSFMIVDWDRDNWTNGDLNRELRLYVEALQLMPAFRDIRIHWKIIG